jgi:hypothetical protein
MCKILHEEVIKLLVQHETSYAKPMNSEEIGEILKVTPSYIRSQLSLLIKQKVAGVRRGNGGGYYVIQEGKMQPVMESEKQFSELGILLGDMKSYLKKLEKGCKELSNILHLPDKSQSMGDLVKILEGVCYFQKLLKSAMVLVEIDFSEKLYKEKTVFLLFDELSQIFASILEATENEDYSLLTDLIEYDLLPAIGISQEVMEVVQGRHSERVM